MRKTLLSLAVLALAISPAFGAGKFNKVIGPGEAAPAITDIPAVMVDKDTTLNLADMKEDVVVVVFLANHCPVVTLTEDRMIDFASDYKDKSVKVVALCVSNMSDDLLPKIKERVKDKGYNFAYGHDASQKIGKAFGAYATPQFFVLDKTRTIRYTGGMDDSHNDASKVTKQYLRDAVDAVLKGESVEVAETKAVGCGISYKK